jgi:hypothetical protein
VVFFAAMAVLPAAGAPFPMSTDLLSYEYALGANAVPAGVHADTWYPSWDADNNLYSSWTDGKVNNVTSGSGGYGHAMTGYATIVGDDPFSLVVQNVSTYKEPATPYGGRYPSFAWPGGAGLAVSFVLNVEEGAELSVTAGDARNEGRHEVSNEIMGSALPDLNDPATVGILLEMLAPKLHPGDEITLFKPGVWHIRIKRTGNLFTGSLGESVAQALLALE